MRLILGIYLTLFCVKAFAAAVTFRDLAPGDVELLHREMPQLFEGVPEPSQLDEALRRLLARGTYENVFINRLAPGQYEIVARPIRNVEQIVFRGVKKISESDLRNAIDIKIGDRFDHKRAVAAAEKVKNYYGEHGYFNAIIELGFEKTEDGNVRLAFDIQEKDPCILIGLKFETPNKDLRKLLQSHFKFELKKPLTTERIKHLTTDLNAYLIDQRYMAAEILGPEATYNAEKTQASLVIKITEPYRYEFYFSGNQFLSTPDIYAAMDFTNHERKNVDPAGEGSERLRRAYLDRGFPNVQISSKTVTAEKTSPYLRRVYYTISEGPRVKIKNIEIQGRVTRSPSFYRNFILNNSSDLTADGYYNRTALENGFKNLTTMLHNQGFLHARVQSSRVEFSSDKKYATIFVLMDEGPQTQIRALEFSGNKYFSSFELAQVTGLETNSALHLENFEQSLDKLRDFYHKQGFLEMKILNDKEDLIKYNEKGTEARVHFQIYEGPRIRVQSIVVEGNQRTKARVILTESDFQIGEVLTPQKLDDATARLNKLGLFSRVTIHTLEENTSVGERTLVITVSESDPGTFTFGGGITSERDFTVRGYTSAAYNNLWGTARAVTGRAELRENLAQVRYPENEVTAGYLEPFLFNTRTRGRINLTRQQYVADYESSYTQITIKYRADFFAERDLTRHTKFIWKTYSLESREDFERNGGCLPNFNDPNNPTTPAPPGSPSCFPNTMQVSTIGPGLVIDYRDNPFMPTRGSYTKINVDYSNPNLGSSQGVEFVRADAGYTYYLNLKAPNWVWANSLHGGYLSNLSRDANSGVPADYSFVLGGIYTLRGFDIATRNERVPRDGDGGFILGETNEKLIKQDSTYYLVKSELRFPIYGDFGGVLFYDGGAVYVTGYHFAHPYDDSAGFGFRYNTPVGPVALDFAFKVHPQGVQYVNGEAAQNAQAPFRMQFSIGTF